MAKRLGIALADRGMKSRVAELCSVTPQAVTGWLKTGRIDKKHLLIIHRLTGHGFEWLLTGEGSLRSASGASSAEADHTLALPLTPREHGMLLLFRQFSHEEQEHTRVIMDALVKLKGVKAAQ